MAEEVTSRAATVLQTTVEASRSVRWYYEKVTAAKKNNKPVVWAFGLVPREIWHALDIPVVTLEHFPLLLAAKQLSGKYSQVAEERGFTRDICAYHSCFLGAALSDQLDAYTEKRFPSPDIIVASNFPCNQEVKTPQYLAEHYKCPFFYLDAPINPWGEEIKKHAVEYYETNLERLLVFLEKFGYRPDWAALQESVRLSQHLLRLWNKIVDYRKKAPTPMGAADGYICLYPLFQLPGTGIAVEIYERLLNEVRQRAESGLGVVDEERVRLIWAGLPPAYNLGLLNYPERYGAVVVQSELEWIGGAILDPEALNAKKPLESLARKTLLDFVNPTYSNRINLWKRLTREFKIDGIIAVNKRGCRNLPAGNRLIKDTVYQESRVPMIIFDLDGVDNREYDDAQVKANIDTFVESLLSKKGGRKQ